MTYEYPCSGNLHQALQQQPKSSASNCSSRRHDCGVCVVCGLTSSLGPDAREFMVVYTCSFVSVFGGVCVCIATMCEADFFVHVEAVFLACVHQLYL